MIRIRCPMPEQPARVRSKWPSIQFLPSHAEVTVHTVDVDGTEHAIEGVSAVSFHSRAGEVTRAVLEIDGVEIDAAAYLAMTGGEP